MPVRQVLASRLEKLGVLEFPCQPITILTRQERQTKNQLAEAILRAHGAQLFDKLEELVPRRIDHGRVSRPWGNGRPAA